GVQTCALPIYTRPDHRLYFPLPSKINEKLLKPLPHSWFLAHIARCFTHVSAPSHNKNVFIFSKIFLSVFSNIFLSYHPSMNQHLICVEPLTIISPGSFSIFPCSFCWIRSIRCSITITPCLLIGLRTVVNGGLK